MKKFTLAVLAVLFLTPGIAGADRKNITEQKIDIIKAGDLPSTKGPEASFTGNVRVDRIFPGGHPSKISSGIVTFEPGARTAWHQHPKGQTIIITQGVGRVQQWGGEVIEVRPGDVVWFPPNVKHWHGASPDNAMSHISFAEIYEGKSSDWNEKVTDKQYKGE